MLIFLRCIALCASMAVITCTAILAHLFAELKEESRCSLKANAICLLQILTEYSDEIHILPMREIIIKMTSD